MLTPHEVREIADKARDAAENSGHNVTRAYYEGAEDVLRYILGDVRLYPLLLEEIL